MTPFDLVLLPFPFTDLSAAKQRPALVLAAFRPRRLPEHLVVAMVTSNLDGIAFPFDLLLKDWRPAGLPKPSLVRLSKLVTLERQLVRRKLGTLTTADQSAVRSHFRSLFQPLLAPAASRKPPGVV